MKILVTGATGFVGNILLRQLREFFPEYKVFEYFPASYGAEDYMALAKEVINRGKNGLKTKARSTGSARLD